MKNLFILPSEKPSRLLKSENNNFMIIKSDTPNWFEIILKNTYQNICIINDDEIKDNTWVLNIVNGNIYKTYKDKPFNKDTKKEKWRKIILTTDQDLIKDGVQAIDDEFLEWFVKNTSCEEIEVDWVDFSQSYFIKIPKEESKQETLEEFIQRQLSLGKYQDQESAIKYSILAGAKWQQEQILDFLYSEITERRDYSASKMCEKVTEFILNLKNN